MTIDNGITVGFVAVNYNNYLDTIEYLDSIMSLSVPAGVEVFVVVVDNGSRDQSLARLVDYAQGRPNITIEKSTNSGYAAGLNRGIGLVQRYRPAFVVVGNSDIEIEDVRFIHKLIAVELPESIMVLAPTVLVPSGKNQNPHLIEKPGLLRRQLFKLYCSGYAFSVILKIGHAAIRTAYSMFCGNLRLGRSSEMESREIYAAHGSCFVLTSSFLNRVERLDSATFLFGEEILLAELVRRNNGEILYLPELVVRHNEHKTMNTLSSRAAYQHSRTAYLYLLDRGLL